MRKKYVFELSYDKGSACVSLSRRAETLRIPPGHILSLSLTSFLLLYIAL